MRRVVVHLVSDSTGETLRAMSKASLARFPDIEPDVRTWVMVRRPEQVTRVLEGVSRDPGVVLCTFVQGRFREALEVGCRELGVPCMSPLDPLIASLAGHLKLKPRARDRPGSQHALDAEYFARIDALSFSINHDDGRGAQDLERADVVLVGVSRTSKTPTCVYLANRGVRAANVPLVPGVPHPPILERLERPLLMGLVTSPERLVQIRRARMASLGRGGETDYVDIEAVRREVTEARRLFARMRWPVLDVSRNAVEETAAEIMALHSLRQRGD